MSCKVTPALYALCALASLAITAPAHADLIGSQVTAYVALPTLTSPTSNIVTATVGLGVEFPTGTLYTVGGGGSYFVIPVSIDLSADQITFSYSGYVESAPGAFNGYVFEFSGLSSPILNAYLDPASSFTPAQAGVAFTATEVTVNVSSQYFTPSTVNVVDLDFSSSTPVSATPEPSSFLLLGTGVLAAGRFVRKRMSA